MEGKVPFEKTWGYPSEVKKALKASWYDLAATGDTFASGRPKSLVHFYGTGYGGEQKIIATREAMKLISKKTGTAYVVCRWEEKKARPAPIGADDVFED